MAPRVYFIKASVADGEQLISEKAAKLFKAGGFSNCFSENDFTAVKVHVGEVDNNTYIKPTCIKGLEPTPIHYTSAKGTTPSSIPFWLPSTASVWTN